MHLKHSSVCQRPRLSSSNDWLYKAPGVISQRGPGACCSSQPSSNAPTSSVKVLSKVAHKSLGAPSKVKAVVSAMERLESSQEQLPARAQQQQSLQQLKHADEAGASSTKSQFSSMIESILRSPYDSAIFAMALPSVLALAADPLLAIVDTAIIGQIGQEELAALGVNTSLFSFAFVVFNFLAVATTPIISTALSSGNKARAGETIVQALGLAVLLGGGVMGGLMANSTLALQAMGVDAADTHLLELAASFLLIRATAAPAALLVTVCQGVFRGLQDMRTPLAITVATNVLHLALSCYFIFGQHMGVSGAALSTSIAEWLAAGAYLKLVWGRRDDLGLWPLPLLDPVKAWGQYMPFLQAGGAVLMRTTVLLGTKTLASAVATHMGPASIASHQVLSQLWVISSLIIDSLAIAGQTLVAVKIGQGSKKEAREVTDRLMVLGLGMGLVLSSVLYAASPVWPHLFTSDCEVIGIVSSLLPLAVAMLPINAIVYVLDGVLIGASDFQFLVQAMIIAAGSTVGLLLAAEPLDMGLEGVWLALAVLMAGRCGTLMYRYQSADGPLPPQAALAGAGASGEAMATQQHPHTQEETEWSRLPQPNAVPIEASSGFPEYLEDEAGTWVNLPIPPPSPKQEAHDHDDVLLVMPGVYTPEAAADAGPVVLHMRKEAKEVIISRDD